MGFSIDTQRTNILDKPIFILSYLIGCYGYPNGPPSTACEDMTPNHGVPPILSDPPFRLSTNKNTYHKGEQIAVSLTSVTGSDFMGFFVQARQSDSTQAVGRFYIDQEVGLRHLTCGAGYNNALSHHKRLEKNNITFGWSNIEGSDVYFTVTVVRNFNESWTGIQSELVRETDAPTSMEPALTTAPTSLSSSLAGNVFDVLGLLVLWSFAKTIL